MKVKLMNRDILIKPEPIDNVSGSSLLLVLDDEGKEDANYFRVLEVSKRVTEVKQGDIILLEFAMHTEPMYIDDQRVAVTSEEKILGVLEN